MNRFSEEWIGANLKHPGKKFHKTKKERKVVFDKNNARRRDILVHQQLKGLLVNTEDYRSELEKSDTVNEEDVLIDAIDSNDEKKVEE